ncbi:hypothetical protein BIV01_17710 [Curtobacterium sp. MCBA15_013]|nr:hypothetical protein BIV01_17710 [Curtobacterium sp. MCBA15_013]
MEWQELLFCRLTGQFGSYISSPKTIASEQLLRLERSIYYGIGRNSPAFGEIVALFEPLEEHGSHAGVTTPFDTGGLAQGHIHLRPPVSNPAEVVSDANVAIDRHQDALNGWIDATYPPGDYRADEDGSRPTESSVPAIVLTPDTDDRGWTWEGRIDARDYDQLPLTVRRVYFKHGSLQMYLDWLEERTPLDSADLLPHEDLIAAIGMEVASPYEAMMEDLGG